MPFPEERDLTFVVCEEVRQEMGGKVSLLGVYGGGDIVVFASEGDPTILPSLSFYYCFTGGEGTFPVRFQLVEPGGNAVIDNQVGNAVMLANAAMNILLRFSPFQPTYGEYQVRLSLGDRAYERRLRIMRRNPPPAV